MTKLSGHKVLIAIDFGMKRIGTAVGQTLTQTARPLDIVRAKEGVPIWADLDKQVKKWQPDGFVVGLPLNMDGTEQPITKKVKAFIAELKKRYHLPCYEQDERLTTKAAREQLFEEGGFKALQGGNVDNFAAKLILENWFQEQK